MRNSCTHCCLSDTHPRTLVCITTTPLIYILLPQIASMLSKGAAAHRHAAARASAARVISVLEVV